MSRSFKKVPGIIDRNPYAKNQANRKIRRIRKDLLANGSMYKKFYSTYDICDWVKLYFILHHREYLEKYYNSWEYERK